MRALILAAGFGSRLMPLTKNHPKCMVEYQGKKIIDYEICALKEAGIDDIAVVGGYLFAVLEAYLRDAHRIKNVFKNPKFDSTNMVTTLFCAREWLESCVESKQDLIISYADIVYFKESVLALKNSNAPLSIVVDKGWRKLWDRRFSNPLEDAETLKMCNGNIIELGKKPKNYDEIEAQYIGLFKVSWEFLPQMLAFYDGLDRTLNYDGKDFDNMYMTSFLQGLIDAFNNAKAVVINGGWLEVDFKSDLGVKIAKITL
ncbi:phosphocholine cytidylyltransferase family protein [Helicobacter sp.]|uniref:phosphocholine cytidylyltransferase family protein n=1 Tax=Helicobacter sp. TaxID=218 RepID=UPI0025C20CE9|nr:phosphocholine cytidylyltransferase family protein [Helicobacter sp.]MCI5967963.1 phosphocholine cytidylyltransferase family protein [Helicobacter sp.]MDY2585076.1 phosphocholine cytidylyltransferase family protein [Helicobacter sp.]